jgi:hypothetical protein
MQRRVTKAARTTLVVAALACSMLVANGSAAAAAPAPDWPAAPVPAEVTLVTGDRVLVGAPVAGRPTLTVQPAPRPAGRTSVVGGAALPWLAGVLAQRAGVWTLLPYSIGLTALLGTVWWRLARRLPPGQGQLRRTRPGRPAAAPDAVR